MYYFQTIPCDCGETDCDLQGRCIKCGKARLGWRKWIDPNRYVGPVFRWANRVMPLLRFFPVFRNYAEKKEDYNGGE